VCQAIKRLKLESFKHKITPAIQRVIANDLDAAAQLNKINARANRLLDKVTAWLEGDKPAFGMSDETLTKDPREIAIKLMAEIRGQLNLHPGLKSHPRPFRGHFSATCPMRFHSPLVIFISAK